MCVWADKGVWPRCRANVGVVNPFPKTALDCVLHLQCSLPGTGAVQLARHRVSAASPAPGQCGS